MHSPGDHRLLVVVGCQREREAHFHDPAFQLYARWGHHNGDGHTGVELARGPWFDRRLTQSEGDDMIHISA